MVAAPLAFYLQNMLEREQLVLKGQFYFEVDILRCRAVLLSFQLFALYHLMEVVSRVKIFAPSDMEDINHEREQQAGGYKQRNGREIGAVLATQVVMHQVARTPQQVANGAEHIAAANAPEVHQIEGDSLPREAVTAVLQATLRTEIAAILLAAEGTHVLLIGLLDGRLEVLLLPLKTMPSFGDRVHNLEGKFKIKNVSTR